MKYFSNKIKKSIAILTATCLLVSFVMGPAFASAINNEQTTKEYNQIFKEFILPYSYGKISKSHFAGTDRVIINIQDLHCHSKVQKNISNIIKTFDEKYGVSNIYLEGAYGDVSTKWITERIKNDSSILEKMLDTGRLTGAEYYSALSGKTELIKGLEEKEPFLENITRLGDLLQNQPKINLILSEVSKSINEVKKKYYTKRQYKIEKLFNAYKDGKIASQKYYTLLSKHIDKLGIDLTKYENTLIYVTLLDLQKDLNYKQITRELQSLISVLKQQLPYGAYKSLLENTSNFQEIEKLYSYIIQLDKVYNLDISLKFAELDKYFKYVELSKKINPVELVKEDEYLSQEISTRFSQTRTQQEVVFLVHFEKYLKDYLSTKITPDDYIYYKDNIDKFRQMYNKYVDNRVLSLLDDYVVKTDKFYEVNMDRNIYFTNNMFEKDFPLQYIENPVQSTNDVNKIIDNMSEVKQLDIVVTGGFHSQTVTELLEKQNVSYIVITPNVTDGLKVAEDIYYEIAKEQSKISFQTIAPLIASLSSQLQAVLLNKIENKYTNKIEQIMSMDDDERAQAISELMAAKLLESDDAGEVETALQEIIERITDEEVSPEIISKIKNLQSLLQDKETLQKVIALLQKGAIKQAEMLVSDMFGQAYDTFHAIVIEDIVDQVKQEADSSKSNVVVPSVQEKKQARELTEEEKKVAKETLLRTKVRIKNSTLEITEENDKNLAMELQTIFDSLLVSMVDMGKINESDKKEYELILYLSDEVNAFTVSGSKTVFISTGMLHSFSTYLDGKIGKEHVAAILAHELEHTVQDKRVYSGFISGKGDQKKDEYDSDIQAIFILDNAGYNPISVQDLMEYLAYLEEKFRYLSTGLNKILDAHPDAENRLVKVKTFLSDRNIFLRSTAKSTVYLESSIPYYGEADLRSDIYGELGYYQKGAGPRDSNSFIIEILKKYGDKIALYKILDRFNGIDRFVDVNDVLNYINSVEYPFFNNRIKNFSDNQKKVIFRLMNSFDGHYPSNKEIYELCPDMKDLKEVFDFIIEPENHLFFFENISFLNISHLVAALYNNGNLGEKDYDKIRYFLSINEDKFSTINTFKAIIDKDTVDFYIDKFDLFDNFKKYKLYSKFRDAFSEEKGFSDKQKEKIRKFFLTPSMGGIGAYHMFRDSAFYGLLYPEMTLDFYVSSITEEHKQKMLKDAEQEELRLFDEKTIYDVYSKKTEFAIKRYNELNKNKWYGEKEYKKWLDENDKALFAEWLQKRKEKWFSDACLKEYSSLMFERFESELLSKLNTLEEKLKALFPGSLMEFESGIFGRIDYESSLLKVLKRDIESIKSKEELFDFIDTVINYFDKESSIKKTNLDKTINVILSNVDRNIINNFSIEDIKKLFELSMLKEMSDITYLMSVALVIKGKNPKSVLDFDEIFPINDYYNEKHKEAVSDFVKNVIDEEQLRVLFGICYERDLSLRDILLFDICEKIAEKFDESISLEEKYRYSIYKDDVYPYNVCQKIKNEEDLKKIPIEHLKRFLGIEIPIHKDYYMNHSFGRIGLRDSVALRILQNKVEQYQQKFRRSFYDVKNFNEFTEKVKEIENVFYPWNNRSANNRNEIFSNEVDMLWANLLHNMCGFDLETKSFVFVNIHGEELLNVWCELAPNYDFVPSVQQTNELLSAFVLIKKYLPKEQSVAYARMLYEMINKNKALSVFESAEKNLELLDFFFEGFSEIKDDYIYELLENYDIDINTYSKCLRKTTYYAYKDETEDTGKNFLYRELVTVLSNGGMTVENKIKFIAWLISDKQEKPEFLKRITVKNDYERDPDHNRRSLGEDAKVDIFRDYFWSMTKSERAEYIRELLTDILKDRTDGKGQDYEKLKNALADAFFDSIRNDNNEKIVDALKVSFKIILDSLASHENKSTSERQILFISDLIDSLVSISKSNFSPEEKEARQIGRFIVAMGAASGVAVVKILQILSNSKAFNGLGEQGFIINEEISKVRSSNEQLSKRVVFQQLETLGMLEDVESVGKCLGSASIGVTYLINMKDGAKKIIKIKRPSVLKNYEQDLETARNLIRYFKTSSILPQSNKRMIPTIEFLKQVIDTELDFEDEVDNMLRAKSNLSATAINTPDVLENYNKDSFIQSSAHGESLDRAKFSYSKQEQSEIYSKILLEFFREVFRDGFFHADLHEGNIFVDSNKNITFIDWGACGSVEESKRDELESIFLSLILSDSKTFIENLKEYDSTLYDNLKDKSNQIAKVLNSKDSLETKLGQIFAIFNQIDMSQNHDFLMFIQGLSKIAKYIDNLSLRDKILLLLDDTVIYDLLKNKTMLSNIENILRNAVPDTYEKIIELIANRINTLNEEELTNIIDKIKGFISAPTKEGMDNLVKDIMSTLRIPSVFKDMISNLMTSKANQILKDIGLPITQEEKTNVSVNFLKKTITFLFKMINFFKSLGSNKIKKVRIKFNKNDMPITILVKKDNQWYSLIFNPSNNSIFLSSTNNDAFSEETSKYTTPKSIENFLGIKIRLYKNKLVVKGKDLGTDISFVRYEDVFDKVSLLKTTPVVEQKEKDEDLGKRIGCSNIEYIYLDGTDWKNSFDTAQKDKLLVIYPFSKISDINNMTDEELFSVYLQISTELFELENFLLKENKFPELRSSDSSGMEDLLIELIKNAFVYGNLADPSKPIYVHIDYELEEFTVYNDYNEYREPSEKTLSFSAMAGLSGAHKGMEIIQGYEDEDVISVTPQEEREIWIRNNGYYRLKISRKKQYSNGRYGSLGSFDFDFANDEEDDDYMRLSFEEDLEETFREWEESLHEKDKKENLPMKDNEIGRDTRLPFTQDILDWLGGKLYKNKDGKIFKFTSVGVILGAVIEFFSFWFPGFINAHKFDFSVKPGMIAVVWAIRALSAWVGYTTKSFVAFSLTEIVLHSVWNRFVIFIGRQDLLLQTSRQKSKEEEITIPEQQRTTDNVSKETPFKQIQDAINGNENEKVKEIKLAKGEKAKFLIKVDGEYFFIEVDENKKIKLISYNDNIVYSNFYGSNFDRYKDLYSETINNIDITIDIVEDGWVLKYDYSGNFEIEYLYDTISGEQYGKKIDLAEDIKQYPDIIDYIEGVDHDKKTDVQIIALGQNSQQLQKQIANIFSNKENTDNNITIALYPSDISVDYSSLSDVDLYNLFKQKFEEMMLFCDSYFAELNKLYPTVFYEKLGYETDYFIRESLKNAFVHGNECNVNLPIVISIDVSKRNFESLSVINHYNGNQTSDKRLLSVSATVGLSGIHSGVSSFDFNGYYNYYDSGHQEKSLYVASLFNNKNIYAKRLKDYVRYLLDLENISVDDDRINKLIYGSRNYIFDIRDFAKTIVNQIKTENERGTEVRVDYDGREYVTLIITKGKTVYSVRVGLDKITEEDKVRQNYMKTSFPNRKRIVYLSSIDKDAFSKDKSEYKTVEDIEKLTGVKIELSENTIVAKSMETDTHISYVKNRDISQIVSSLTPIQIPIIDRQQQSDVEKLAGDKVTETIYLDESSEEILGKLKLAIKNNSLIVIYPFSRTYNLNSLKDEQLYALYFDIQNKFLDLQELLEDNKCLPQIDNKKNMSYVLKEFMKNAFVHGNSSDTSKPIYIKFVENGFTVYNEDVSSENEEDIRKREKRLYLSAVATLTGNHRGLQIIQDYEKESLIKVTSEERRKVKVGDKEYFVISAVKIDEFSFNEESEQEQIPEEFINLTDDYNQFEHMEGLPDFSDTGREETRRQNAIDLFNYQLEDISSKTYQFVFRGNTKYLYLLQNRKNKYILLNIASQPDIELKFRLFALLYLDELSYALTSEERTRIDQAEKAIVKRLKKQIENNEFEVLNNLDLRAYMMGVYLMLRDHADKISVPDIINRAIIINPYGKKMARDDGLFAEVDLFIVIHELAHRMFYKPRYTDDTLEEFVSYIVPNIFLRKIMNLSFEAYSKTQNLYTIHQTDGIIDHIKMGRKFHSLYSMFDKNAEEYKFKQEEHSAPIAFLDYLFAVHQKAGKPIDWDVLLDVIRNLSVSGLDQLQMLGRILDLYMKRSVEKGSLTKEETENMKKEIEEMQIWTILVKEVMEIIESTSPNIFNLLKGNKKAEDYKTEILSTTKEMKETFEKFSNAFMMNFEFSKSELLVLLIMNIMKNVEYEQLENNFDGVINGIIDVINNVSGELKIDLNRDKFNQQEYKQMLNFVLANYAVSEHVETSVTNDIYTYISKNLDYLSFATKLINMVFGTRDLTKIFSNKKLLIATSKQQEEDFIKLLSDRAEKDIAVVTMEVIKDRVYDIREGSFLDVQKGIKATYDSKENKIIVYSKEGINIDEDKIKDLITEQYFSERKDDTFDDVIAFAGVKDISLQDITDRLNIAYTESVSIPNKETTFDLSSRKSIKNIINVCNQEASVTGIKTFIITPKQAREFSDEVQVLREQDFKFIILCNIDTISEITYYDGLIIDDSKTDYEDISQLLPVMEKVRKHVLKAGVAKPASVKFSNETYGKFNSAGINIFDTYGMLPIVEDSYITNSMKGKFVVEKIRDNNIERFLRQNNVVGFVIDNARTFADKKSKLRDLFSKEHKYNKGYNAALSSKFDYTCADVKLLTKYFAIEIDNDKDFKETDKQSLDELTNILLDDKLSSELKSSLSFDSKAYLKYLGSKGRYEEMTGFIRGIAMNSAKAQIVKGLGEKGIKLNMNKFANVADGKYQKAFLTIAVQLMMEDIDVTDYLETDFIDSDMTVKEYLDSVLEKVNINIEEILKKNEYKIEKIEKKDIPKTIEDFKNYVVLLDNLKVIRDTTAGLDMSIKAVRSMLSAA